MSRSRITAVVPVYNAQHTLNRCVDSILAQTIESFEILLIDDGSSDSSSQICDDYAAKDDRIKVFHKENGGVSSARNLGIENAAGEFIGFVDSDDYIAPEMFKELYDAAVSENAGVAVCGRVRKSSGSKTEYVLDIPQKSISSEEALKLLISDDRFDNACYNKIFKSELIKANPFPANIRINEELMPIFHCIEGAERVALVNKIFYTVDTSGASATRAAFSEKFLDTLTAAARLKKACVSHPGLMPYASAFETVASMDIIRRCVTDENDCTKFAVKIRSDVLRSYKNAIRNPAMSKSQKIKLFTLKAGLRPYRALMKLLYGR
ncbi:MAG: glycosyltransferase family 2 protein [Acutalibacteraceae bacterium]